MKKRLTKSQIFTIPNLLSMVRIAMIPLVVFVYVGLAMHGLATALIALAAFTDILDGWIARRFDMISDVGKVLDPVADKLMQAALMICVWSEYPHILYLFLLFAVKEIYMLIWGLMLFKKKDDVSYALWHGKLNTTILICVLGSLFLFPDRITTAVADILFVVCAVSILFSSALYTLSYIKRMKA